MFKPWNIRIQTHCQTKKKIMFVKCILHAFQVFDISRYQESLAAYFALGQHQHINQILEILLGETRAYVFFERSYGDMHSFVRTCKKLPEDEAARLFFQIASAVAHCHDNGLVLRDLKLRKFVFKNEDRWALQTNHIFTCTASLAVTLYVLCDMAAVGLKSHITQRIV